jgi:predicted nucleotidyltransferase
MFAIEVDKDRLREFCTRWRITEFWFFGSVTRPAEFRADSDVDVLVRFEKDAPWTFFQFAGMELELAEIFGRPVDLVELDVVEKSENPYRKRSILNSKVQLDVA